jgi:diguanylate cyclase (GGDEF)-like protein/PAS domain S-box-containing protein
VGVTIAGEGASPLLESTLFSQAYTLTDGLSAMTNNTFAPTVTQEQYLQLEKQYRKLFQAVESSPTSVIITNPRGEIEYTNPKFTEITGYSADEVKGKNPRILKSGLTKKEVFCDMWRTIKAGQQWHGEMINRKKDGTFYHEYAALSPVMGADGKIINFVAVKLDISAQKKAELEKEKAHAFLQMVIDVVPEGIMVIEHDYRIKLMNKVIREAIDPEADYGALYCYQVSHHRDTPCAGDDHPCPLLAVAKGHKQVSMLHQHRTDSGEVRYIELVAAPLFDANGKFDGIIESGRDVTERKLSEKKLQYLAHYDTLTDIPNRVIFFEKLRQVIATASRTERMFGVLFIDLDGFKKVNDTFGHKVGDQLLMNAAKRLSACIRHGDTVARMGGDEFAVILAPLNRRQDAEMVSQKIQRRLSEAFRLGELRCTIGASVGISCYPGDGDTPEELLKKADDAMYHDKRARKKARAGD